MKKPLTIFVSSTFADLVNEREGVVAAITKLQHQYDSMEFFGARSERPIETCLAEVRRSNVLVVIVGHRYGSIVPEMGISFTEAEYNEGYRLGKPSLVYVRDDNVPILPKYIERDPEKMTLLEKFKDTLKSRHTVATFRDAHDLSLAVAADLSRVAQALEETTRAEADFSHAASEPLTEANKILQDALDKGISTTLLISTVRQAIASLLSAQGKRHPLVFFSYSHADHEVVQAIASELQKQEIDVWIDTQAIQFGENIVETISRGLDSADFVAFFLSANSLKSKWSLMELNAAMSRRLSTREGAVILPILLEDVEIPALLRDVQYIDLRGGDFAKAVQNLVRAIRHFTKQKNQRTEQARA
ncbi:MAG: TIR domain-containing protein [Chloroflexi bacterium]|nr:TIR domain-containing protein [Chloroflexota bacterium]